MRLAYFISIIYYKENDYSEALSAFCDWCVDRGYLADDSLKALSRFDTTPQTQRRAMTVDEVSRLLDACVPHRKLLLEAAFLSGLRAKELQLKKSILRLEDTL